MGGVGGRLLGIGSNILVLHMIHMLATSLKDVQYDTAIVLSHDFGQQAADLYLIVFFIIV